MIKVVLYLIIQCACLCCVAQNLGTYQVSFDGNSEVITSNVTTTKNDDLILGSSMSDSGMFVHKFNKCRKLKWVIYCSTVSNSHNQKINSSRYSNNVLIKANDSFCYIALVEVIKSIAQIKEKRVLTIYCIDHNKGVLLWSKTINRKLNYEIINYEILIKNSSAIFVFQHRKEDTQNVYSYSLQVNEFDSQTGKEINRSSHKLNSSINFTGSYNLNFIQIDDDEIYIIRNIGESTFLTILDNIDLSIISNEKLSKRINPEGSFTRYSTITFDNDVWLFNAWNLNDYGSVLGKANKKFDTLYTQKLKSLPLSSAYQLFGGKTIVFTNIDDKLYAGLITNRSVKSLVLLDDLDFSTNQGVIGLVKGSSDVFTYFHNQNSKKTIELMDFKFDSDSSCKNVISKRYELENSDTVLISKQPEKLESSSYLSFVDTPLIGQRWHSYFVKVCNHKLGLPIQFQLKDTTTCNSSFLIVAKDIPEGAKVQWSTGDTTETISINSSGYYFVSVSNGSCQVTDSVFVQFIKNPLPNNRSSFNKCENDSFNLELRDFEYFNLIGQEDTLFGTAIDQVWLKETGTYKLETKPEYACAKEFPFTLSNSIPMINLPNDTILCDKMELQIKVSSSYNSYFFVNSLLRDSLKNEYTLQNAIDSITVIKVIDSLGCESADTMLINEHPRLNVNYSYDSLYSCRSDSFKLNVSSLKGKAPIEFQINDSFFTIDSTPYFLQGKIDQLLNLKVNDNCGRSFEIPLVDANANRLNLKTHFSGADTLLLGNRFSAFASVDNGTLYWYLNEAAQHSNERFTYLPTDTGSYDLKVKGEYLNCQDSASKTYYVTTPFLYVPNAFTVNNDGLNEQWQPICYKCMIKGYKIFNRWGQLIFESDGNTAWDGTLKGENIPLGVYQAIIYYTDETGKTYVKSSAVYLLR